jgi:hypothetical protein
MMERLLFRLLCALILALAATALVLDVLLVVQAAA